MSNGFVGSNIDVGKSSGIAKGEPFVLTFQGLKVQKHVCGDGVWRIKRCPPSSNTHCLIIKKDSMKHYDARIIARKTICGIPNPCYNGLWLNLKGFTPIHHKFYFCADDLIRFVRGIERKYYVDKPLVPSMWPVQVGIDLIDLVIVL
jgi:hypothetical protein